ncbi:uncharacterized protein LOC141876604 isoform X5 [Acropora palmata]|uniref:uncharacterized protein LOC141876604 isoform X5 n=1 Tax=Acropora palmata TaxID=6131 RepID=UPI003DA02192
MASSNQFGWDRKHALKEADFHEKNLADEIGVKWKDLARALGFSQAYIDIIAKENINSVKECCLAVLVSWLRQEGERATWGMLSEALVKIGLTNVAERFTCKPSDQSQNSEAVTVIRNLEMELAKTVSVRIMELKAELTKTMSARSMELEAEVNKMSARNKNLEAEVDKTGARNKKLEDENSRQSGRIKELEDMIQKNKAVLETVAVAVQEMEKNPEQRREEILKRIKSEVQELLQQLKRVDVGNADKCLVSSIDGKNIAKNKEPKNDLLGHDATVPQQDEVHLLQSCEEQMSLYQGIFDAFVKLIPEVGELKDYNFESISKLCNFAKELKEQEKLFSSKIESLNSLKDNLNEDQPVELEKLAKWYQTYREQFDQLQKLLSMLLPQGKNAKKQSSKSDTSKHPSHSQSLSELPNIRRPSISGPFCPRKTWIMDTDKKPEEVQSVRHSERRHNTAPSGKNPKQQNDETTELARSRLKTYPSEETLVATNDKAD